MKTKQKYYAVWDLQTGHYMATGMNCQTKEEVRDELYDYFREGADDYPKNISLQTICDSQELVVHESNEPFEIPEW
jgi:hypothetical protein